MQFFVIASILSSLVIFIVPKFMHLLAEIVPGRSEGLHAMRLLVNITRVVQPYVVPVLVVVGVFAALRRFVWRRPLGRGLFEAVGEGLPVVRGLLQRRGLAEAAAALSAFLAAGVDLGVAATSAAGSAESRWARRRLPRFAAAVSAGQPGADAWTALGVQAPFCDWMVCNAFARERPAEGFQAVAAWAADDLGRRQRRLCRWLEPALLLVNALIVGFVIFAVLDALCAILYSTLNF